ncbi:TorF family putative porin [Massilia sp. Mn16-1_5]|uniref:TorF family putative porin n=1 Tax=Massilia sp. Mn16-1_5 TaxID=2079199 RepID=UPI001445C4AF|nr:TorF family putative porin [Massilia sp. Mn16-1_5]
MSPDRRNDRRTLSLALAGLVLPVALYAPGGAQAQTSITLGLVSEYSLRGLSLSDGRPAPQLRIDHDTDSGWYGGAFVSRMALRASPATALAIGYAGYARRLPSGWSWDAGVKRAVFLRDARNSYVEAYAGISHDDAGARLSLSPAYYGAGRSAYFELNGVQPLGERWRLSGHAGLLHWLSGYGAAARNRIDLRAAIATDIGDASIEIGVQARQRDPGLRAARARALFAGASLGF